MMPALPCSLDWDRSLSCLPSATRLRAFPAVAKFSFSCRSLALTGTAFPPPALRVFRVAPPFPEAFGTMRFSDSCWVFGFHLFILHPTSHRFRGIQQVSLGNARRRLACLAVSTHTVPANIGLRRCPATYPPRTPLDDSLSLGTVEHLWLLLNTPSRAPRSFAGSGSPWCSRVVLLPHRCRNPFVRVPG
jgi:hypothetical protein